MHNERCTSGLERGRAKPFVVMTNRRSLPTLRYLPMKNGFLYLTAIIDVFPLFRRFSGHKVELIFRNTINSFSNSIFITVVLLSHAYLDIVIKQNLNILIATVFESSIGVMNETGSRAGMRQGRFGALMQTANSRLSLISYPTILREKTSVIRAK